MGELQAGAAMTVITPPSGIAMAGYSRREGPSQGVHDDLFCRALVLSDGEETAAIISCDLIGLAREITWPVCLQVAEQTDIPPGNIMIACTHTHSGPHYNIFATPRSETGDRKDERDLNWERNLPRLIAETVCSARERLAEVQLSVARSKAKFGVNRRLKLPGGEMHLAANYGGTRDPEVLALSFTRPGAGPVAAVLNYTCHAVTLCEDNLLYSADYPGYAVARFEEKLGGGGVALFFNGACGNIDPYQRGTFQTAEKHGRELADSAWEALSDAPATRDATLRSHLIDVNLPIKDLEPLKQEVLAYFDQTKKSLAVHEGRDDFQAQRLQAEHQRAEYLMSQVETVDENNLRHKRVDLQERLISTQVHILAMGEAVLVGLPGEVFVEVGLTIKRESPFTHTLVVGYCNDLIGYVPIKDAYPEGGYEVLSSRLAPGGAEKLLEVVLGHLQEIA